MARLLVVDDDPYTRELLKLMLCAIGHEVDIADNGAHAMQRIEKCQPSLVITDILMPEMDGFELISVLAKKYPAIKILAISAGSRGFPVKDSLETAKDFGAIKTLTKPIEKNLLIEAVNAALADA